jgi:hypothetical protein
VLVYGLYDPHYRAEIHFRFQPVQLVDFEMVEARCVIADFLSLSARVEYHGRDVSRAHFIAEPLDESVITSVVHLKEMADAQTWWDEPYARRDPFQPLVKPRDPSGDSSDVVWKRAKDEYRWQGGIGRGILPSAPASDKLRDPRSEADIVW